MASGDLGSVLRYIRTAAFLHDGGGITDGQLLEGFLTQRDEAAFAALVRRHGPMVLGVCRRVLRDTHDAEDAFQATFLVLVRKAASLRQRELVGNWLYGVAYRAALETKAANAFRRARERQVRDMPEPEVQAETDIGQGLRQLLDRELDRLPEKYRVPVVLCHLEGRKRKEVARQLRIPEGTLSSRLATARRLLAQRLARHRLTLAGGVLAAALAHQAAPACVPTSLQIATVKAATLVAVGQAAAPGLISARVASLVEGVLKAMLLTKLKTLMLCVLAVGVLLGAASVVAYYGQVADPKEFKKEDAAKPAAPAEPPGHVRCLEGHKEPVLGVVFSPDGKRALSASSDGTVRLWDLATGKELRRLIGHAVGARSVAFSPDGKFALSTGDNPDRTVRYWDLETGIEQKCFEGNEAPVHGVVFTPDGKQALFGCSADKRLRLLDIESGNEVQRFEGHTDNVHGVAISPDGKRCVSCSLDGTVRLWEVETGKELRRFEGHIGQVFAVAMSPDGKRALSAGEDKTVRLWDLNTGKEVRRFEGHTEPTLGVAFSPKGRRMLSSSYDNTIRLWDLETGKELHRFEGHTEAVYDVVFSPDGRFALSASKDKTVRLWRLPR
jgi:RNA polymerase sigma factor (sigma-70 family)